MDKSDALQLINLYEFFNFIQLEVSTFVIEVLRLSEGQILKQRIIKLIIWTQFKKARWMQYTQFAIFIGLFYLPFIIQLFSWDSDTIRRCNVLCFIHSSMNLVVQLITLRKETIQEYFKQKRRILDLAMIALYAVYFFERQISP